MAALGMSSTVCIIPARVSRSLGRHGANVTPQFPSNGCEERVPADLSVKMRMEIDKAWCHGEALGVDLSFGLSGHFTDL